MKPVQSVIVVLFSVAMVLAVGFVFLTERNPPPDPGPSLESQFEDLLNFMLRDVQQGMRDYRNDRKVFQDLVRPENLRDVAYIEENYRLMQDLGPQLHLKIQGVLDIFTKADEKVRFLLQDRTEAENARILDSWNAMRRNQVEPYREFFRIEEELLGAYEDLMTFYYVNAVDIVFDPAVSAIHFVRPEQETRAQALLSRISDLSTRQAAVFAEP